MANVELLYGNEPYCVWYHKKKAIKGLECPEIDLAVFSEFSEEVVNFSSSVSMFGGEKLCILQVNDLKTLDTTEFNEFIKTPSCNVLIIPEKADCRTKLFKSLPLHACNKVDEKGLTTMILKFLGESRITGEAIKELIKRLNYFDSEDVNLFTVKSVCSILGAYTENIGVDDVKLLVDNYEEDNAFILIDCILNKRMSVIRRQEDLLNRQGKSVIGALSAMLREYRLAYKTVILNKPLSEVGAKYAKLKALSPMNIVNGMEIITKAIEGIKAGRYTETTALSLCCEKLMAL